MVLVFEKSAILENHIPVDVNYSEPMGSDKWAVKDLLRRQNKR